MFGFTYKSANKRSTAVINATQAVLSQVQIIGCQEVIPQIIYNIKNTPNKPRLQSPQDLKSNLSKEITNMTARLPGASKTNLNNSLTKLVNVVVDNSTVKGKIDQALARQNMVDVLSSFCPGKMMGKYDPPPKPIPITDDQSKQIETIFDTFMYSLSESDRTTIINNVTSKVRRSFDGGQTIAILDTYTSELLLASGALKPDLKLKLIETINKLRAVVKLPPLSSATTKSTFGSMSHFGSMGGSWIMILLLLIIVAVLYFYSQGKLKFPTMGQRVAQFGRDMKSIRGIRARR